MEQNNEKVVEAIEFFETMLESMPCDRTSLEFLSVAYEQVGQPQKRRKCLIELADALINEKDFADAQTLAERLLEFSEHSDAVAAVERLNTAMVEAEGSESVRDHKSSDLEMELDGSYNVPDPGIEIHATSRAALSAEMDLVWTLKDKEVLPREICEGMIRNLSEFPVSERPQLIAALSLLDDQHPEWTDRVMCELQKMSKMPAIPLELFNYKNVMFTGISSSYIRIRGVIPFAKMADEYLVGILNPLDKTLQQDVARRSGSACHFFLIHPRTCQKVLDTFFELNPAPEHV